MDKYLALLLYLSLVIGCSTELQRYDGQDNNKGYFKDATECSHLAMRKELINVPTAGSISVVEVPTGYDEGKFIVCMAYAKRPVARDHATEFLKISTNCLHKASGSEQPDNSYADCMQRSRLSVEIISDQ